MNYNKQELSLTSSFEETKEDSIDLSIHYVKTEELKDSQIKFSINLDIFEDFANELKNIMYSLYQQKENKYLLTIEKIEEKILYNQNYLIL